MEKKKELGRWRKFKHGEDEFAEGTNGRRDEMKIRRVFLSFHAIKKRE